MTGGRILTAVALVLCVPAAAASPAAAQVDVTPPELSVSTPDPENFTFFQSLTPYFFGGVSDDVTAEPTVVIDFSRRDDETHAVVAQRDLGPQSGGWAAPGYLWPDDPLEHGFEYDGTVTATDEAGNETVVVVPFYADGVAPRVTVQAPAETQDSTVFVSGTASTDRGDIPFINVSLDKPTKPQGSIGVVYVQAPVQADGTWSAELPEVEPGKYGLRLSHVDKAMNGTTLQQPLEVLPPPPPAEPAPEEPPPPPPLPFLPPPPAVDAALAGATSLQRSAAASLRSVRMRTLLRRGAKVCVDTGAPGAALVQLVAGRTVLAKGARTVGASGRGTVAVRATAAGRRTIRRARRAKRFTLRVRFTPAGGAARTLAAPLTLRR